MPEKIIPPTENLVKTTKKPAKTDADHVDAPKQDTAKPVAEKKAPKKAAKAPESKQTTYRNRPLIRKDDIIYYGDMADTHVALLQILAKNYLTDIEVPTRVLVQIISTDQSIHMKERIVKHIEKDTLYEAINIAAIWLERTLENA